MVLVRPESWSWPHRLRLGPSLGGMERMRKARGGSIWAKASIFHFSENGVLFCFFKSNQKLILEKGTAFPLFSALSSSGHSLSAALSRPPALLTSCFQPPTGFLKPSLQLIPEGEWQGAGLGGGEGCFLSSCRRWESPPAQSWLPPTQPSPRCFSPSLPWRGVWGPAHCLLTF